jgi:hypothetical protein
MPYNKLVQQEKIAQKNTYNINKSRFLIRIIESTCTIINLTLCIKYQVYLKY